jgi:hypothetical protein
VINSRLPKVIGSFPSLEALMLGSSQRPYDVVLTLGASFKCQSTGMLLVRDVDFELRSRVHIWEAEPHADTRIEALLSASKDSATRRDVIKASAGGDNKVLLRQKDVDIALQSAAFVAVAAETLKAVSEVPCDNMCVMTMLHQGVDGMGGVHILQRALSSLTVNPVAMVHEIITVVDKLRPVIPEYYTKMLAAALNHKGSKLEIPAIVGTYLMSKSFLKAFLSFNFTDTSFDLFHEWCCLQATLQADPLPKRLPAGERYTKFYHFSASATMLTELLRLRGMEVADTSNSVTGVLEWIRRHLEHTEQLQSFNEKLPKIKEVWASCLDEMSMHMGTLRTHGPLHQAPLQTHMGEGSRTLQMMSELDEGWEQLVKLRQLHPSWMVGIVPTSPAAPGTGTRPSRRPEPPTKNTKTKRALEDTPPDKKNKTKGKPLPDKSPKPQPGGKGKGTKPTEKGKGAHTGDREWGSKKGEVKYDSAAGTVTFSIPGEPVEVFTTTLNDGVTIAEFVGDKDRPVCFGYCLSPHDRAGCHCNGANRPEHKGGAEAPAHKGLTKSVRAKCRSSFRLE